MEAAIASLLLDDAAVANLLNEQQNDVSVTKFLAQDDNTTINQDDRMLMIEFLEHDPNADNDISVTKFLDSAMTRYLQ